MTQKTEEATSRRDFLKLAGAVAPAAAVAVAVAVRKRKLLCWPMRAKCKIHRIPAHTLTAPGSRPDDVFDD